MFQIAAPLLLAVLVSSQQAGVAGYVALVAFGGLTVLQVRAVVTSSAATRYASLIDVLLALIGLILSLVYLVLLAHPEQSILYRMNFGGYDVNTNLPPSFAVLASCILLANLPLPQGQGLVRHHWVRFRQPTAWILALVGATGLTLVLATSRTEAFQQREGGGGGGLLTLAYWAAAAFVVYVIVGWRREDPKVFGLIALAQTAGLLVSGNRSPIALLALALLVRLVDDGRFRLLGGALLATPIGLLIFAYQSAWRGLVSRSLPADPTTVLSQIWADPGSSLVRLGLDSIDGHALSVDLLEQGFGARLADPLTAVLNFIPRAVWPGKPTLLGGEIGRLYLGTSGSGIFLSGPGYLSLVTGATLAGSVLFILGMLFVKLLIRRPRHPFFAVVACYLAARFTIAGDAFDIFLALQLLVIVVIAEFAGRLFRGDQKQLSEEKRS